MNEDGSVFKYIWSYKVTFALVLVAVFASSLVLLYVSGLVPDELVDDSQTPTGVIVIPHVGEKNTQTPKLDVIIENPIRVQVSTIGVDSPISNPVSTNEAYLNGLLKKGVVHYPGSGSPGKGNMFLFAHSANVATINPAYRAFNDLDKVKMGDEIKVQTAGKEYVYRVTTVQKMHEAKARIDLSTGKNMITLTTCDTFSGIAQQRIIVQADFAGSYDI